MSRRLFIIAVIISSAVSQETAATEAGVREPRSLKKKLCHKYGICNGGYDSHQGGYQGQQGYPVPINIAISQSQSSSNGADGGHANGYYPNNYQYNGGYPNHGGYSHGYGSYNQGYGGHNQGYGGYNNQGYGGYGGYQGHRPGYFGNGQGAFNNQFNGNYYGGQGGGYGFHRQFGEYSDEDDSREDEGFGFARSLAVADSKSK